VLPIERDLPHRAHTDAPGVRLQLDGGGLHALVAWFAPFMAAMSCSSLFEGPPGPCVLMRSTSAFRRAYTFAESVPILSLPSRADSSLSPGS